MGTNNYSRNDPRYTDASPYAAHYGERRSGPSRRTVVIGGVAFAAVAVAAAAVATPAMASGTIDDLKTKVGEIATVYKDVVDCIKSGDFAGAQVCIYDACDKVAAFKKDLDGPLWSVAELVPVYGSDVKAARSLVAMLDDVTSDVLVPMSDVLVDTSFERLIYKTDDDGIHIDVDVVTRLSQVVKDAMPVIEKSVEAINGIGTLHIDQLKSMVEQVQAIVGPLEGKLGKIGELLDLVPQMLGANGERRTYLVVAQNNVEIRPMGGFAGAWCPVYVENGTIEMGDVSNKSILPTNPDMPLAITDEERYLFGDAIAYTPSNSGFNPDFPRVCDWWQQFWSIYYGEPLCGVVAVDPIFFQSVVGLTNGVAMPDGSWFDGTNAARALMHDAYWTYMGNDDAMDAYFATAVGAAIEALFDNISNLDFSRLIDVIEQGIDNYNLFLWFADAQEEAFVNELGCSGELFLDEDKPELGIYLSNETWSKIEWWLNEDVTVGDPWKSSDGRMCYPVSITLTNVATWDEINAADDYILGVSDGVKYRADDIVDTVFLYAPAGGYIDDIETSGSVTLGDGSYNGLQVVFGSAHILIDEPVTISFNVMTAPGVTEELHVRKTPTVQNVR